MVEILDSWRQYKKKLAAMQREHFDDAVDAEKKIHELTKDALQHELEWEKKYSEQELRLNGEIKEIKAAAERLIRTKDVEIEKEKLQAQSEIERERSKFRDEMLKERTAFQEKQIAAMSAVQTRIDGMTGKILDGLMTAIAKGPALFAEKYIGQAPADTRVEITDGRERAKPSGSVPE